MASFNDSPFFYISAKETRFSILGGDTLDSTSCKEEEILSKLSHKNEFPLNRLKSICSAYESEEQVTLLKKRINEKNQPL